MLKITKHQHQRKIMQIQLHTVSAFTAQGKGGNLAGVVLNADTLNYAQKQQIAKQAGYSETAFVSPDSQVDFSVSFFTPTEEVDFCGHATVALFYLLYQQQTISAGHYQFSAKAGLFAVTVTENAEVIVQQALPKTLANFSAQKVAPLLNLTADTLQGQLPIEVLSTGLADLIVPIPVGLLDKIKPNLALIKTFCSEHNIIGLHLFELNEETAKITASCRNFAPLVGIDEESATGSACGALACYLNKHLNIDQLIFEQGRIMNCLSLIKARVSVKEKKIITIEVGGFAKLIKSKPLQI